MPKCPRGRKPPEASARGSFLGHLAGVDGDPVLYLERKDPARTKSIISYSLGCLLSGFGIFCFNSFLRLEDAKAGETWKNVG